MFVPGMVSPFPHAPVLHGVAAEIAGEHTAQIISTIWEIFRKYGIFYYENHIMKKN